jgi:hypothetical protein
MIKRLSLKIASLWREIGLGTLVSIVFGLTHLRHVESLLGRMTESTRQVDRLFESLPAESFGGGA